MTERRRVRVAQAFFDRLDELLADERGVDGTPSSADFLLHDMPAVIDRLAESYEPSTVPIAAGSETRVLITSGHLVEFMAVYTFSTPMEGSRSSTSRSATQASTEGTKPT